MPYLYEIVTPLHLLGSISIDYPSLIEGLEDFLKETPTNSIALNLLRRLREFPGTKFSDSENLSVLTLIAIAQLKQGRGAIHCLQCGSQYEAARVRVVDWETKNSAPLTGGGGQVVLCPDGHSVALTTEWRA